MERPSASLFPSARTVLARVRNPVWTVAALFIIVYGLREAQAVLLPIVVAALLAVICNPGVRWLEARRVPNVLAVLLVVAGLMGLLFVMGALVGGSVSGFRDALPEYVYRLETMFSITTKWLEKYGIEVNLDELTKVVEPGKAASQAMNLVSSSMNALVSALSNTFLVVLTMILILMEGKTVPAKLRAVYGDPEADISHFTQMAGKVQSYLAIKTVLSLATGLLVGVWAAILGVDFAMLWGLLAFLLNYIPNIGSILAAVPAMLLALVQLGVWPSLALGAGYVVVNTVIGNVIEPMWMGRKLGLSTTVVFLSLAIWYEIWGPVGMLLSVPLTMVLKIMLEHSREGEPIAILLDTGEDLLAAQAAEEEERRSSLMSQPLSEPPPTSRSAGIPPPPADEQDTDDDNAGDEPTDAEPAAEEDTADEPAAAEENTADEPADVAPTDEGHTTDEGQEGDDAGADEDDR